MVVILSAAKASEYIPFLKSYIKVIKPRTCLCRQTGSSDYTNDTNLDVDRIKANDTKIALKGNLFVKLVKIVNT